MKKPEDAILGALVAIFDNFQVPSEVGDLAGCRLVTELLLSAVGRSSWGVEVSGCRCTGLMDCFVCTFVCILVHGLLCMYLCMHTCSWFALYVPLYAHLFMVCFVCTFVCTLVHGLLCIYLCMPTCSWFALYAPLYAHLFMVCFVCTRMRMYTYARMNRPRHIHGLSLYWGVQAGLLTPLTFSRHRLSPLTAFTSGAYFLHNGKR